jgi:hypothetical protein
VNGPTTDAENEANKDLTAFDITDVHGYFELGRRIRNTGILVAAVAFPCLVFIIGLKVLT